MNAGSGFGAVEAVFVFGISPDVMVSPKMPVSVMNRQTTMLQLAYYHYMMIIHQASE